ncbi:uncharacterized protein PADG_11055 [Paracoccidioides brasiliensis Pb18]|uniref:Uncharacterized protein n=1 Tax=Paracoccidioides brasiliensis (strain Pb18) TaxID=502780 RepID=A0A0A0HX08_PARBD|nr:uncharacterized protein PADG_11055 [Paracoccidioides brasiliensis Pb18]KGM92606.1 hypothetical protein PADG_11055 [Paracoccidioides brasiliensis Pb18]
MPSSTWVVGKISDGESCRAKFQRGLAAPHVPTSRPCGQAVWLPTHLVLLFLLFDVKNHAVRASDRHGVAFVMAVLKPMLGSV